MAARKANKKSATTGSKPVGPPKTAAASTATKKHHKRKINETKVLQLYQQGMIATDIAKQQGVAISTITRYLETVKPELYNIKTYSGLKADALCLSQLKLQAVSNILLDHWLKNPEASLTSQDMRLQKEILVAVQGAKTYEHTAERLERGMSTANFASLTADIAALKADSAPRASIEQKTNVYDSIEDV